jgi:DNA-binding transcriptional ArsR family regulator
MSPLDFNAANPMRTADSDEPETLFKAVQALSCWDERSLHWTDVIVTEWVADALASPGNREGWAELHSLLERIQVIQPVSHQPDTLQPAVEGHYYRWDAMADLLAARAHRHDSHDPQAVAARTHMDKLKQALHQHGRNLAVSDLPELLGLSRSRISQLLSLAEAAGLIERFKEGGKRRLNPSGIWSLQADGAAARDGGSTSEHQPASSGREQAQAPHRSREGRGASCLFAKAA